MKKIVAFICAILIFITFLIGCQPLGEKNSATPAPSKQAQEGPSATNSDEHRDEQGCSLGLITKSNGDGTCNIVGYEGADEILYIPDTMNGETVVAFAATEKDGITMGTFEGNTTLQMLNIPPTVTSIEQRTFAGCSSLNAALIPATVISIGKDAFADCSALKEISCEASSSVTANFNYQWNPDGIPVALEDAQGLPLSAGELAAELFFTGLKSFAGSAAGKLGNVAANNLLSMFGYVSPEEQFRTDVNEKLDDIQGSINKMMNDLSNQLTELNERTVDIRNQLDVIEKNVLASSDKAELANRMTTINQYIAKIDTLYDNYQDVAQEADFDVAKLGAQKLISQIEKADLPVMINYICQEMAHSSAGTQTPLITLYDQYLKKVYPFAHQTTPKVYMFVNYMQSELVKAIQLYTEYCNYKQAALQGDSAQVKLWQKESEKALDNGEKALEEQKKLLPSSEYSTLKISGKWFYGKITSGYRLVNEDADFKLAFSDKVKPNNDIQYEEDADRGPRYYFCDDRDITLNVTVETFKKLESLRKKYDPYVSNLEFINKNAGTEITAMMWGCNSELIPYFSKSKYYSCPTIDINNIGPRTFDIGTSDGIYTWIP